MIDLSFRMVLGFAQTEGKLNLPEVVALQIDESELALVTDFVSNVESALLKGRGEIVRKWKPSRLTFILPVFVHPYRRRYSAKFRKIQTMLPVKKRFRLFCLL